MLEENYKDGQLNGLQTYWFRSGQKESEINFKNGKQSGKATKWSENGKVKNGMFSWLTG